MTADVICMALASVPSGEQRARFLAVGLMDSTVRIISLDPAVSREIFTVKDEYFSFFLAKYLFLYEIYPYYNGLLNCHISMKGKEFLKLIFVLKLISW